MVKLVNDLTNISLVQNNSDKGQTRLEKEVKRWSSEQNRDSDHSEVDESGDGANSETQYISPDEMTTLEEVQGKIETQRDFDNSIVNDTEREKQTNRGGRDNMKVVLWYDIHNQSMVGMSQRASFSTCLISNCRFEYIITNDKDLKVSKPFEADAVLVQSKAIFFLSPPPRRDKDQVFVLAVRDVFKRVEKADQDVKAKQWLPLFNWTMTYRLDSDIVYKYSNIHKRMTKIHSVRKNYEWIFSQKERSATWIVSHCSTSSRREEFVKDLQKVIDIDIFGACGTQALCPKSTQTCFEDIARKYKFYLAFENTYYTDYVSEKLFNWYNRDIIVVVRGGANYSRIVPEGTFIDASEFKSPSELGEFLNKLSVDKDRYISYLRHKDNYYSTGKTGPTSEAVCKLCEYLHDIDNHRKTYEDIRKWWMEGVIEQP